MSRDNNIYGSVTYSELFNFFKKEIEVRLVACSGKSEGDVLYQAAREGAQSLLKSFLLVGEMIINKNLLEKKITGESLVNAQRQLAIDYAELARLMDDANSPAATQISTVQREMVDYQEKLKLARLARIPILVLLIIASVLLFFPAVIATRIIVFDAIMLVLLYLTFKFPAKPKRKTAEAIDS